MRKSLAMLCLSLGLVACGDSDPDRQRLQTVIAQAVNEGVITHGTWHRLSSENLHVVRVTVSSVVPAEGRRAADRMCDKIRASSVRDRVRVESVLLVGNRPAGACYSK